MKLIYSNQDIKKELNIHEQSIFLAGPTPRSKNIESWRPHAIRLLEAMRFVGQVLIPERGNWESLTSYDSQVDWEDYGLSMAGRIVFWVPRRMDTMPALTTNVEFGRFAADPRSLYGRPDDAEHVRYLDWLYTKYNGQKIHNLLSELLFEATKQ